MLLTALFTALSGVCLAALAPHQLDLSCPADPSGNVTFFPHPTNCSQYLQCDNGQITVMECPDGLQFNPDLDVCDFEWNVNCEADEEDIPVSAPHALDLKCPDGASGNGTFFPHPTNCSQYFQCDNGQLTVMECPDDLQFNPELNVCDFEWNVECETEEEVERVMSRLLDLECPNDSSGNVTFFPHPTNCSQYLACDNGLLTVMECPDGLQFHPDLNVCDFESNVDCEDVPEDRRNIEIALGVLRRRLETVPKLKLENDKKSFSTHN